MVFKLPGGVLPQLLLVVVPSDGNNMLAKWGARTMAGGRQPVWGHQPCHVYWATLRDERVRFFA